MVAREREAITSSKEGALLIDDLAEWLGEQVGADPEMDAVRRAHPDPDRIPSQVALGYFLLQPTTKRVEFEPEKLLVDGKGSLGWDLALAQAHRDGEASLAGRPGEDPDYRFAVVQAEMYRRHLKAAVADFDAVPLSRYLAHFARWYRDEDRPPEVERVAQGVFDEGLRGLGLAGS
jgi:hypothetical protein